MTGDAMEIRARGHIALRAELDRQGVLHAHERELLVEAADALLFDEPEAQERWAEALVLLDVLESVGRRTTGETTRLRDALELCGTPAVTVEITAVAA
jgi:hypothetical protein